MAHTVRDVPLSSPSSIASITAADVGDLFCKTCTQQRMVLRGHGDSLVCICEPCKKLEEAARFEMRHGHKNRTGRGGSKMTSRQGDEVLNQILGNDRKELVSSGRWSTTNMVLRLQRDTNGASCSNIQEITTHNEGEEIRRSLSVKEPSQVLAERESSSPEKLHQQALDEKKKYKILKAEGKSEEALKAFKRGKELERQAGVLELLLRKNLKKALSSSNMTEIQKIDDDSPYSGWKNVLSSHKSEEKDNLATELRGLGWSDMDLRDADKKPARMSLEGELSTLLGEVSQKINTEKGSPGIDKPQVIAHKKKALTLKREGKRTEAKEELKRAKVLEKQLEEQEFLAGAEDSDDELSALIDSMDSDKQDNLLVACEPDAGFDVHYLMGITDGLGFDCNFEVTDEDMDDPDIAAALKSLGWTDETNHFEDIEPHFVPVDREALLSETQSLKREALNQKKAGNTVEALQLLKKAKVLEKDLDKYVTQGTNSTAHNSAIVEKGSVFQPAENPSTPKKADVRNVDEMDKADAKLAPKSRLTIQKELLGLKKRALALRREDKLDEADEELKKGKVLEQQLEEMDNASEVKATGVNVSNKHADNLTVPDLGDGDGDGDVTDQDMHDATYISLLTKLGWKDEDDKNIKFPSKSAKQDGSLSVQRSDSSVTQTASSIQMGASRISKGEIQRELLSLKRKALALRCQGETEEAEEVLKMAKVLEAQLAEMEVPTKGAQTEIDKHVENENISSPHENAVEGDERGVSEEDRQDPALLSVLKILGWKDEVAATTMQAEYCEEIASNSVHPDHLVMENLRNNDKIAYGKRDEMVHWNKKPHIDESGSVLATVSHNDQSVRQEILVLKRKAVALKREGQLAEASEALWQAKLLEKSLVDNNSNPHTATGDVSSSSSNMPSVGQKEHGSSNLALKPLSGRDRFKLQQESLSHKQLALKLQREGRTEEAEAEFELAKSLEAQFEELAGHDSAKSFVGGANPVDDVGIEDFLDPQIWSALKAVGFEDASIVSQSLEKPEPVRSIAGRGGNSVQERTQLEEQIKEEKVKAVNLKRSGK